MASSAGTPGAVYGYGYSSRSRSGSYSYTAIGNHHLTRQRSMPAAVAAAFASFGRGGDRPIRSLGDGDVDGHVVNSRRRRAPTVGAVVRAVWAWIGRVRRRRKAAAMGLGRSRSSAAAMGLGRSRSLVAGKERRQYWDEEEYAQNFDEGAAAAEPENLSRNFSARYARQRQAPWWEDGAR